jgi:mono/diheme cytochrome c family protein
MKIHKISNISLTLALGLGMAILGTSCRKQALSPGYEYMPDMYRPVGYEYYSINPNFADSLTARKPVEGTVSQGSYPYEGNPINYIPYTLKEGDYELAASVVNPVPATAENVEKGKEIYTKFCVHCHGEQGKGDGSITQTGNFPPPPAYNTALKDLTEGKMFHTLTYGKGLMGSHASQLSKLERWTVIRYVQTLQKQ